METKLRSAVKSIVWRITGVIILAAITYLYTQDWMQTGLVALLHHGIFLVVYYLHERAWLYIHVEDMFWRSLAKMFTYETLCGNIILGAISYCVTGDLKQMTYITLTYIGIKHICYIVNEYVWKK